MPTLPELPKIPKLSSLIVDSSASNDQDSKEESTKTSSQSNGCKPPQNKQNNKDQSPGGDDTSAASGKQVSKVGKNGARSVSSVGGDGKNKRKSKSNSKSNSKSTSKSKSRSKSKLKPKLKSKIKIKFQKLLLQDGSIKYDLSNENIRIIDIHRRSEPTGNTVTQPSLLMCQKYSVQDKRYVCMNTLASPLTIVNSNGMLGSVRAGSVIYVRDGQKCRQKCNFVTTKGSDGIGDSKWELKRHNGDIVTVSSFHCSKINHSRM